MASDRLRYCEEVIDRCTIHCVSFVERFLSPGLLIQPNEREGSCHRRRSYGVR